jgi:glycosidase
MNANNNQTDGIRNAADIDLDKLSKGRTYFESPATWEDQVLYFLMLDRFSDGKEYGGFKDASGKDVTGPNATRSTPLFQISQANSAQRDSWFSYGKTWCGGKLLGLKDKLGYLSRMGVTAVWISPIFKQVSGADSYHGYGIQNFLEVDPNFGTRQDLADLVKAAHALKIRVILDIVINHGGDVFCYPGNNPYYYWQSKQWPAQGFRVNQKDAGSIPFRKVDTIANPNAWPDGAIWPSELQSPAAWTREGEMLISKVITSAIVEYIGNI